LPAGHPDIAVAAGYAAQAAYAQEKYPEAMQLFTEALNISQATLGPDHLDTAQVLFNLGLVHRRLGNMERAETMLRQCLEIRQRRLGERHPLTLQAMESLARTLEDRGDMAGATYLHEQVELLRSRK
jgi:tetratricopeptide (TPR) repeat protein